MLSTSDRPIEFVISALAARGIEAGYLVPTRTGLEKSILDAHDSLRDYLRLSSFHDFNQQAQGEDAKRVFSGFIVTAGGIEKTKISLYRPTTKTGDPRIWIYGLKGVVNPGNLLAVLAHKGALYVVNVSDRSVFSNSGEARGAFAEVLNEISAREDSTALELLNRLKGIASLGWVRSQRSGPTGVGYTLETLLGIQANSSKAPDYNGIELKAGRSKGKGAKTRTTLFSKVPDWDRSALNASSLLSTYGYLVGGRRQIYCSLKAQPNSLGHYLEISDDGRYLYSMFKPKGSVSAGEKVFCWNLDALRDSLGAKHRETFWVKARTKKDSSGAEFFQYTDVIHTRGPLLGNFSEMLRIGGIELDYALHEKTTESGSKRTRDHGYLFKIWQQNLKTLFPPSKEYSLIAPE